MHTTVPGGLATLPIVVTEHAAHTSGSWNGLPSTADSSFEASRLGSQLIRAAVGGYETYIFKARSAPLRPAPPAAALRCRRAIRRPKRCDGAMAAVWALRGRHRVQQTLLRVCSAASAATVSSCRSGVPYCFFWGAMVWSWIWNPWAPSACHRGPSLRPSARALPTPPPRCTLRPAAQFSTPPSRNGGIIKTGIHWAENTAYPFPVGDSTLSAEAARLIIAAAGGAKTLDTTTVTVPSSTPNGLPANNFRVSAATHDRTRRYFIYVNDCGSSSGAYFTLLHHTMCFTQTIALNIGSTPSRTVGGDLTGLLFAAWDATAPGAETQKRYQTWPLGSVVLQAAWTALDCLRMKCALMRTAFERQRSRLPLSGL